MQFLVEKIRVAVYVSNHSQTGLASSLSRGKNGRRNESERDL